MIADLFADPKQTAWKYWAPRPDQPERYDEQESFFYSDLPGVAFLIGGNGAGTTETAIAKVCRFVLNQPPPRQDTPFYIIASSYEQAMKVCWKDKMLGHGHMPRSEVDWERVAWHRPNDGWPFRVPLKPFPGRPGKNWSLEFKSYDQGQAQFMADSIGGFMFSEQFPWGLLEEVLRGCREYNFHGAKLCEFTPVDPMLSAQLEEMIDQDKLPPGWEVFRANTEVAMEAGHVSEEWYQEFFGLISDEMTDVRKIGAFGSYRGRVYPTFGKIHMTDEPLEDLLVPGMFHRRGLDWGFGEDNAFCCEWGAKRGDGSWLIYDEYYSTDQTRTIHDHLKAIADKWDWPSGNPHYGVTYADPSDPGNIRLASKFAQFEPDYENFTIQSASNRVFEGIEHVRWLMKPNANGKPRIVIHRPSCPKLVQQMKTYRFRQGTESGRNPTDARPEILKKNDHACFPAGTMLDTPHGPRAIETIMAGDKVCSHLGVATVDVGTVKIGHCEIIRVTLEDGRTIECTAEHPLAVDDTEWVRADECVGRMVNVRSSCEWSQPKTETQLKSSSTVVSNGEDTLHTRGTALESISAEACEMEADRSSTSGCTNRSTSTTLGQSQAGSMCITRTKTRRTTIPTILQRSAHLTTRRSIQRICARQSRKRRNGIAAQRALNGTERMGASRGIIAKQSQCSVSNAVGSSALGTPSRKRGFVPANAVTMPGSHLESMTSNERVRSAVDHSLRTVTESRKRVRANAVLVKSVSIERLTGTRDVFCCATSDGSIVVNGVMAMQCDALRYLVFSEANSIGTTPEKIVRTRDYRRYGVLGGRQE